MVKMEPVNAVTAIALAARSEDQSIKLTAPCKLLIDIDIDTEDQRPVPFEAAVEGLAVMLAFGGSKRSKAIRLEAPPDLWSPDNSIITFASSEITTAGWPPPVCSFQADLIARA